mgnify:CR=1 FL=1
MSLLDRLRAKQNARQDMTGLLGQLIAEDVLQIRAVANRGLWGETDSPSDIKVLEKTLKQKRISPISVAKIF